MRKAGIAMTALAAVLVAMWSLGRQSAEETVVEADQVETTASVAPAPTAVAAAEDAQALDDAAAGHPPPAQDGPFMPDDPPSEPRDEVQEVYDEMAELLEAADACDYPNLGSYVNLDQVDPAAGVRVLLENQIHPEENKLVRDAVRTAVANLRDLLDREGCL